jgi:hypothetical protein
MRPPKVFFGLKRGGAPPPHHRRKQESGEDQADSKLICAEGISSGLRID